MLLLILVLYVSSNSFQKTLDYMCTDKHGLKNPASIFIPSPYIEKESKYDADSHSPLETEYRLNYVVGLWEWSRE
jgi:hypothetical protein